MSAALNESPPELLPYREPNFCRASNISWLADERSPGVELGVPSETAFHQAGYDEYLGNALDLDSSVSIVERARGVRELAERVGSLARRVDTLSELRMFVSNFQTISPVWSPAKPWLGPEGEFFNMSYRGIAAASTDRSETGGDP